MDQQRSGRGRPGEVRTQPRLQAQSNHSSERHEQILRTNSSGADLQVDKIMPSSSQDDLEALADSTKIDQKAGEKFPRYLIVCFPTGLRRVVHHIEITQASKLVTDAAIISQIKTRYEGMRSWWARSRDLRGFSGIRLSRVCQP